MSNLLKFLLRPYLLFSIAPDGGGGGAEPDRGDDLLPDPDAPDPDAPDPDAPKTPDPDAPDPDAPETPDPDAPETPDPDAPETPPVAAKEPATIPKARLNQEIAKRRKVEEAANQRIAELERQIQSQRSSVDIETLELQMVELDSQYDDAIADGDKPKAKELKAKVRVVERQIARTEAAQQALFAKSAAVTELKYDMTLSQMEIDHPELNPDDEAYNRAATDEVAELVDAFKRQGLSADRALKKAVKYVLGEPKTGAPEVKENLRTERALEARKKAVAAVKKAAAPLKDVGDNSDTRGGGKLGAEQIAKLNYDQFSKLDEASLARARGDDL